MLLVHDEADDDRTAWFGTAPHAVALDVEALRSMGEVEPVAGRVVDVLIRAALGTGAGVRISPHMASVPEGVGALLRF
jgi:hypothetical protein